MICVNGDLSHRPSVPKQMYDARMATTRPAAVIDEPPAQLKADLGWLCAQTLAAYAGAAEPAVRDLPCGMRGYLVLAAAASGCANNQLEVARRLGIDRSVMVGLLDSLELAGLVARQPNPTDRRERVIAITASGSARLATIQAQLENARAHVLAPLTPKQRQGFVEALHTVVAHIGTADVNAGPPCLSG
jgi:DNA-binding MarR family transcriptional regulator